MSRLMFWIFSTIQYEKVPLVQNAALFKRFLTEWRLGTARGNGFIWIHINKRCRASQKNRTGHVPLSGRRTRGQTPTVLLNGRHVSPQLEQTLINTRTNNCARAPQRRKTRISSAASLFNGKMPQQSAHDVIWGEVSGQKKRSIHSSTKSAIFINATAAAAMGLNTRVQTGWVVYFW